MELLAKNATVRCTTVGQMGFMDRIHSDEGLGRRSPSDKKYYDNNITGIMRIIYRLDAISLLSREVAGLQKGRSKTGLRVLRHQVN